MAFFKFGQSARYYITLRIFVKCSNQIVGLRRVQEEGVLLDLGRRMVTILRTGGKRKKTEGVPFTEVLRGKHSQLPAGVAQW